MRRVKDDTGSVHFHRSDYVSLCGAERKDLLGCRIPFVDVRDPVTCVECTRIWMTCKHALFTEVTDKAYDAALEALCNEREERK